MSKRAAKFVSAIFAGILAGASFTTVSHGAPEAADSCLSGPKGSPPAGSHWYYRIDRASKRPCWYLGEEKDKLSRAAPENLPPPANSISPPLAPTKNAGTQRSIANARAELPSTQMPVEQEANIFNGQRVPAAEAANPLNDQRAITGNIDAGQSVVASRWPELSSVTPLAAPGASAGNSGAQVQSDSQAAPAPAVAAVTLAAADASSGKPSSPVQMLLIAIVGALSVAGLIGSAIFRSGGRPHRTGRREVSIDRRAIWDSARTDRPSLSDEARATASVRQVDLPREPRAADDPNERIKQMLARLARSAAT